jgi:hypothetical protein
LTEEAKTYMGKKIVFSTNDAGKTGYLHVEAKLDPCLSSIQILY